MNNLCGIMEQDIFFKFRFQFTVFLIFVLLLGNRKCKCAPFINSTELLLDNTDDMFFIQRNEIHRENTTLSNSTDEFASFSERKEVAGSAAVTSVDTKASEWKDVQESQNSISETLTSNSNTSSGSTMPYQIINREETEYSKSTIDEAMLDNSVSQSKNIGGQKAEFEFREREKNNVYNFNSNQTPTVKQEAQFFFKTTSKEPTRNDRRSFSEITTEEPPINDSRTFSNTTAKEPPRNDLGTFSKPISEEPPRNDSRTFSKPISEEPPRNDSRTVSETISEGSLRNDPRALSGSSSQTPKSALHEYTKISTSELFSVSQEISLSSNILANKTDVELTTPEDGNTSIDISTSKSDHGLQTKWDSTSERISSASFSTTHVQSTFKSLQSTDSPLAELQATTEHNDDEYKDQLHQALVSVGRPDSLSDDEAVGYHSQVLLDEPRQYFSSSETPMSSSDSVSPGPTESVSPVSTDSVSPGSTDNASISSSEMSSREVTPSTESVNNVNGSLVHVTSLGSQDQTKEVAVEETKLAKAGPDDAEQRFAQSQEPRRQQQPVNGKDVIELPDGVLIDALFDTIDSLQDQLDICEEGIRQRLVVHQDVFFATSQHLKDTGEEVELQADELTEEDLASPQVTMTPGNQQGLAKTAQQAWDDGDEDDDDDEQDHVTTNGRSDNPIFHTLDKTTAMSKEQIDEGDTNDAAYRLTSYRLASSMSGQLGPGFNRVRHEEAHDLYTREEARKMEEPNHVTNDGQSHYYASVARRVIERLSTRLKYLEVSITECRHLTRFMTSNKSPP